MRRFSALLGLVPLLGLSELALHGWFAARAPDPADYAALAPELMKLKRPGEPVVVAPAWAEPLLRQAAPEAFPLRELARPDERSSTGFLEVSVLGHDAPELGDFPSEPERAIGPFRVRRRRNPQPEPARYDFVTAVADGQAQVYFELDEERANCELVEQAHTVTGGLHGHVAYPRRHYRCPGGQLVGVTLIDDEQYRPRRCILAQAPESGSIVLRFEVPRGGARLVGFAGASYFLERDVTAPQVELSASRAQAPPERRTFAGAAGWKRFELAISAVEGPLELRVRRLSRPRVDYCFALEAR